MRSLIPAERVIGCVVHLSSTAVEPGRVRHVNGQGLILGRASGGSDGRLQTVATLLSNAGFAVTLSERIQREVWFKLWGNMTMNPISALTGATCDRILDDPLVRAFCSAVMLEAQAIGAAFGIPIDQRPEERHAVTRKLGAFKTSMLQDAEAGRPLEIDALLGAVREIGSHVGIATPNVDALVRPGAADGRHAAGAACYVLTSADTTAFVASLSLSRASALHCSTLALGTASKAVAVFCGRNSTALVGPVSGSSITRAAMTQVPAGVMPPPPGWRR